MISYDEFKKVEIKAGKILSAEKIPDTDKLLKLSVDFGEFEEIKPEVSNADGVTGDFAPEIIPVNKISKPRQIVSGISLYFPDPAVLVGKTCMFVTNLEPRNIKGYESNGMLFAVSTKEGGFSLLEPNSSIPPGTQAA
jgi:tRNA-binding EMAP/Myf-like protein